jgi:RNA polymerase sigma factor (sigma-70 family)
VIHDETIVEKAKTGNQQAFRILAEGCRVELYKAVYAILRNERDAEDAVQEVLVKVYYALPRYEGQGFKTWITRIAVHHAIDMRRKLLRSPTNALPEAEVEALPELNGETLLQPLLRKEQREQVRSRLNELPENYRDIIMDYYIHEKSYKEIAEAQQVEVKTVEVKLYRARSWIRKHWKEEEF